MAPQPKSEGAQSPTQSDAADALIKVLREFIRESGKLYVVPPQPKGIAPFQALVLVLLAVDLALLSVYFEQLVQFTKVTANILVTLAGGVLLTSSDRIRARLLMLSANRWFAAAIVAFFVPLFIPSIITYQIPVVVEPDMATVSVDNSTESADSPVPVGSFRPVTLTLRVGENSTPFPLSRWTVLRYSLQATWLGRRLALAPLRLRFRYWVTVLGANGGELRVEGIDGAEVFDARLRDAAGKPVGRKISEDAPRFELLTGKYIFLLRRDDQKCDEQPVEVNENTASRVSLEKCNK